MNEEMMKEIKNNINKLIDNVIENKLNYSLVKSNLKNYSEMDFRTEKEIKQDEYKKAINYYIEIFLNGCFIEREITKLDPRYRESGEIETVNVFTETCKSLMSEHWVHVQTPFRTLYYKAFKEYREKTKRIHWDDILKEIKRIKACK